jgi:hypothetical protein
MAISIRGWMKVRDRLVKVGGGGMTGYNPYPQKKRLIRF